MAMIELVDFNELLTKDQVKKKKTRRRGGKKTASSAPVSDPAQIEDAEIIETEEVEVIDENKEEKSEDTANETKAEKKEDTLDEKEDESSEKDKNKD